jgi:hypothetical protein
VQNLKYSGLVGFDGVWEFGGLGGEVWWDLVGFGGVWWRLMGFGGGLGVWGFGGGLGEGFVGVWVSCYGD